MRTSIGGILAEDDQTLHLSVGHLGGCGHVRVVTCQLGDPLVSVLVLLGGGLAVPGLQQGDHEFRKVGPVPAPDRRLAHVLLQGGVAFESGRVGQVPGQQVEQGGYVGRSLDRRVSTQRHDPASGPAHVSQQQLQDAGGADDLRAKALLRPAHRIADGRGPLASGIADQDVRDLKEELARRPADAFDQLRRVARVVSLQDLEDAARVLQAFVPRLPRRPGVGPG